MTADDQEKNEEDKDLELDLMAEQELLRLTRQYRVSNFFSRKFILTKEFYYA